MYPEKGGLGSVGALGPSGASEVQRSPAALFQADDVMRCGGVTKILGAGPMYVVVSFRSLEVWVVSAPDEHFLTASPSSQGVNFVYEAGETTG